MLSMLVRLSTTSPVRIPADVLVPEINFFYPIHSDEMVEKAVAANSAAVFDEQILAANGPLGMGYLLASTSYSGYLKGSLIQKANHRPFGDHRAHRFLNTYNPKQKILESHAFGIGAPTKA